VRHVKVGDEVTYERYFCGDWFSGNNPWSGFDRFACGFGQEAILDGESGEFSGAEEDAGEHGTVEATGVGVAQGWVISGEQVEAVG
jgi:hypothetical protein